jgi:hypothetical protein
MISEKRSSKDIKSRQVEHIVSSRTNEFEHGMLWCFVVVYGNTPATLLRRRRAYAFITLPDNLKYMQEFQ